MEAYGFKDQDFIEDNLLTEDCCCCSVTELSLTLCDPMDCSMLGFPVHHQLPELVQTYVCRASDASNHLILYRPLLLPSVFSSIRVFSNQSALHISFNTLELQYFEASVLPVFRVDFLSV